MDRVSCNGSASELASWVHFLSAKHLCNCVVAECVPVSVDWCVENGGELEVCGTPYDVGRFFDDT